MSEKYDPYADALEDRPTFFYGQFDLEAYEGFFQAGHRGGIHYDENAHGPDQWRMLLVDVTYIPLSAQNKIIENTLSVRGNRSAEYQDILRPALEILAPRVAELKNLTMGQFHVTYAIKNMFIRAEWVDRIPKDGFRTLKPDTVYADKAECQTAFVAETGRDATPPEPIPFSPEEVAQKIEPSPERVAFAAFLPTMWAQAKNQAAVNGTDAEAEMAIILDANKMMADAGLTVDSEEVKEVMSK